MMRKILCGLALGGFLMGCSESTPPKKVTEVKKAEAPKEPAKPADKK